MKRAELQQKKEEALRAFETSMDKMRRASRKNEKAVSLCLHKKRPFLTISEEPIFDEELDSGIHELS